MNGIEVIKTLANKNTSSQIEDKMLEVTLQKIGFPKAKTICGIVYLEGKGTLTCPPISVNSMAKHLVKNLEEEGLI